MPPTSIPLSLVETLAIAALGLMLGRLLARRITIIHRLCLPEPVVGGLVLCAVVTLLRVGGIALQFDTSLQTPLMIAFFLSIGWMASFTNLKRGGPDVFRLLVLCSLMLVVQNLIGAASAVVLGQSPLLGLLAGSVSMAGGPGTALAFAPAFETAGVEAAAPIGTACALAGIILGGLMGSPVATSLMGRFGISSQGKGPGSDRSSDAGMLSMEAGADKVLEPSLFPQHFAFFIVVMAIGALLGRWIQAQGITLPIYIGSMIVAALVRNISDIREDRRLSEEWIEQMGSIALSYFLVVATMTLDLSHLANLAGTLVAILALQLVAVLVVARWGVFRLFGRDYDAAVMSGGFIGFMLGTTANALANMDAISARHGSSARAYLTVPLVGACFIDFINALLITFSISVFS